MCMLRRSADPDRFGDNGQLQTKCCSVLMFNALTQGRKAARQQAAACRCQHSPREHHPADTPSTPKEPVYATPAHFRQRSPGLQGPPVQPMGPHISACTAWPRESCGTFKGIFGRSIGLIKPQEDKDQNRVACTIVQGHSGGERGDQETHVNVRTHRLTSHSHTFRGATH